MSNYRNFCPTCIEPTVIDLDDYDVRQNRFVCRMCGGFFTATQLARSKVYFVLTHKNIEGAIHLNRLESRVDFYDAQGIWYGGEDYEGDFWSKLQPLLQDGWKDVG